jgi:hypothetical protein
MISQLPWPDDSTIQAYGAEFEFSPEDVQLDLDNELTEDEVAALLQRDAQAMDFLIREWHHSHLAARAFYDQMMLGITNLAYVSSLAMFRNGSPVNLAIVDPPNKWSLSKLPLPLREAVERKLPRLIPILQWIEKEQEEFIRQNVPRKVGRPGVADVSVKEFQQRRERGIPLESPCIAEASAILTESDTRIWPDPKLPPKAKTIAKYIRDEYHALKR